MPTSNWITQACYYVFASDPMESASMQREVDLLSRFGLDPIGGFLKTCPRALGAFPADVAAEWLAAESLALSIPERIRQQTIRSDVANVLNMAR
jgi:hypothetical protein